MFKKETLYINALKQNNQLKIETRNYINLKIKKSDNSTFLVEGDVLADDLAKKLNNLQKECDFSYISTMLLSDTTKLVPKNLSSKIKDCQIVPFNTIYDIAVLKTTLFETQNYFAKTGVDFIYSAFHILNSYLLKYKAKNELLLFIHNNKAYVLIVDKVGDIVYNEIIELLTFDTVRKSHFYEDDLERQKLFDELYYLEFAELLQKILKDFYTKKNDIFIQKISILSELKTLNKEQLSSLSQELMLKIDNHTIDIDEEIFALSLEKQNQKSFIKARKKKKNLDIRYLFVFIIFLLLGFSVYKIYTSSDFKTFISKFKTIENQEEITLEKLPDHILNNSKIELRLKAIFDAVPNEIVLNSLIFDSKFLELQFFAKDEAALERLKENLTSLYEFIEIKKLDKTKTIDFEAFALLKNELELQNVSYGIFTKEYLKDEEFNEINLKEQLKVLLPEESNIEFINKYDAKKVDIFSFEVSFLVQEPKEFFSLLHTLNTELYSINIGKTLAMKKTDLGIKVDFILQFNQMKN